MLGAAAGLVALIGSVNAFCGTSSGVHGLIQVPSKWVIRADLVESKLIGDFAQIDTSGGPRGAMQGINICNSTTQNQQSECVNMVVNNISDFCFYAPPDLDIIANTEGETVAFCTQPGYGTRLIPAGTLTGVQVVKTPGYIAIGGFINGPQVNIPADDSGGELDPHGADNRGNPIGSLVYSKAYGNGSNNSYAQVIEWHEFISGTQFCMKICDPNYNSQNGNLCLNIYDTIGCNGNVPLDYGNINGTFKSCLGDNQQVPNGGALPIPATSSCTTYTSASLYTNLPVSGSSSASASASAASSTTFLTASSPTAVRPAGALASPSSTSSTSTESKSGAVSTLISNVQLQGGLMVSVAMAVGAAAVFL